MAAYATGDDLIARYDIDLVGDLATDDRETLLREDVADNARVVTAIEDASGEVEVALTAGRRYSVEQLSALTGNTANHLKQIVCALAVAALHRRRPESAKEEFIQSLTKDAREAVQALRRGENVFGLDEALNAGVVEATGPSALQIRNRNGITERMGRYFPATDSRLPRGQ